MTGVGSHASMAQSPELKDLLYALKSLSQQQAFVYDASFKLLKEATKLRGIAEAQEKRMVELSEKIDAHLRVHSGRTRFQEAVSWTRGESLD